MESIVLHNTYICMRHAQSVANEKHIIISDPESGIHSYGLTEEGNKQVLQAIVTDNRIHSLDHIYSSDFLRAYQTASIVAQHCNNIPVIKDERLRERFFGQFEGTSSENYHKVWNMDCTTEYDLACYNVEPIHVVAKRMMSFLLHCEKIHSHKNILIVSHGDPLQVLYAIANGLSPQQFKSLPHFANAEVRVLPSTFTTQEEYVA